MTTMPGWLALKRRAVDLAQPLSVHLELTYACNWSCVFCYNPRRHDVRRLSGGEWTSVLDELRALGTLTLTLTGGEPLLHPEFLAIARAARDRAFALRVFTNGALVDDGMADALAALSLAAVEMSLHGARAETHDRATGRPGSFLALWSAVARLQARGVPLALKTPLTRINEDELEAMIDLAAAQGLAYRLDASLTPRDDGDRGPLQFTATAEGVARMYRALARQGRMPNDQPERGGVNCGLGHITMAIDPEGNVYPCMQWRSSSLGNVREQPLREMWRRSPVRQQAAEISRAVSNHRAEAGGDVAALPFCPALAMQHTGDPLAADPDHARRAAIAALVRLETRR